jgi:hypothetical protein
MSIFFFPNTMTIQKLIDRFTASTNTWDLISELSNLLRDELNDNLTDDQKSTLNDFRSAFMWDTSYRINCEYIIPVDSLWGYYEVDDLKDFVSIEEGQETSLTYDDLRISDEDLFGGEVQVESKEVRVRDLRIKPEIMEYLGLKKD